MRNPFSSFENKVKLGSLKTGCIGCKGCKYEFMGFTSMPCCVCNHNIRNKTNYNAKNYYEPKQ